MKELLKRCVLVFGFVLDDYKKRQEGAMIVATINHLLSDINKQLSNTLKLTCGLCKKKSVGLSSKEYNQVVSSSLVWLCEDCNSEYNK